MNSRNIVMLIVCCLASILYVWHRASSLIVSEPAQLPATQLTIEEIISHVKQYREDDGKWPIDQTNILLRFDQRTFIEENTSDFLGVLPNQAFEGDSWGTPFLVIVSKDRFTLISAGADRVFHTSDDITGCFPPDPGNAATNGVDIKSVDAALEIKKRDKQGDRLHDNQPE